MEEETLAPTLEALNEKIDLLINEEKEIKQKMIAIMKKLDKIQEYNEIDDMRNRVFNHQLGAIVNKLAKMERDY